MMRNNVADLLTSVDDLFTTQETRDKANLEHIVLLPPEEISDYPNHPFQVRMDEEMEQMTESVKEHGVLVPVLVRPKPEGGYEMVAGHRRKCAAKQARLSGIPCIVRQLTDDEAVIVMVDSNLQREKVLPSERAFAYKMRMEVMERRQGQRNDLTSANDLQKLAQRQTSRDKVAEKAGKSHETIRLYICLTNLIPELLELVDNSVLKDKDKPQIALRPAVELSYLKKPEQQDVFQEEDEWLDRDVFISIMEEEKPNQKEQFTIPKERISKYFKPGTPAQKIEDTIIKALELYRKRERAMER